MWAYFTDCRSTISRSFKSILNALSNYYFIEKKNHKSSHKSLIFIYFFFSFFIFFFFKTLRQLYFRHPHGSFAQRALTHVGEGVILSFIISPILCLPTYFIFRIKKTEITENETIFLLYHLDAKHDTGLYRYSVYCSKFFFIFTLIIIFN